MVCMVYTIKSLNTASVEGGTGWYSVVLGQNRAVLVASMMSFQKKYGLHGLNHQIIEYSKKEKVITDKQTNKQTDRISSCRLHPFCRRGLVKMPFLGNNTSMPIQGSLSNMILAALLEVTVNGCLSHLTFLYLPWEPV